MKTQIAQIIIAGALLVPAVFAENRVDARRESQQGRIAQGVKSGQLTAGETAKLETREHRLNQEIRRDRVTNGGRLTSQERRQVNRQQNRLSGSISADKHNFRTQPR